MKSLYLLAPILCVACASGGTYEFGRIDDRAPAPRLAAAAVKAPAGPVSTEPPALLNRKRRPLPAPTEHRLTNGIRVLLLERHEFPSVSASFVLDRGSAAAAPGVAALYSEVLEGDSADFTGKESSEFLHYVGARRSTWAGHDAVAFRLTVLSPLLDGALVRVGSMFTSPRFATDDLARARRETAAAAAHSREAPTWIADNTARGMLLGANHPYAVPVYAGVEARYEKMSRNELENFRNMFVVPERMTIVLVGDFQPKTVLARLEHRFGRIAPKKSAAAPAVPHPPPPAKARIIVVPRKGASQSNVVIGFAGVPFASEDQAPLAILQSVLGRSLSGRLNLKVRGEHGYTYGVELDTPSWREAGTLEVKAAIDTPHTAEAVKGLLAELARIGTDPIEEMTRAKVRALSTFGDAAPKNGGFDRGILEAFAIHNLPLDWYEKTASRVETLTEADVRAAGARLFTTDRAQIAIVGDPDLIVGPLRALGIAEVEIAQPER